nr:hypothetical protein [Polyangiaceae bacterium]
IYSGILNGIDQGSDTANRYVFRVPLPGGVTVASKITALSHMFGKTSEFSAIAPVTLASVTNDLAIDDLSLSMNPTRVGGPEYSYFVAVRNKGPSEATGLTMTLSIPPMVSMNSFLAPSWSCTQVTTTITCTRASMPSGLTSVLELRATSYALGSFSVNASIGHAGGESVPTDNFKTVTQAVVPDTADLQLAASVFPAVPSAGAAVTYELTVTNQGPDPATALYASLNLPSGSTYQSFMGINWSCTGGGNSVNCTRPGSLGFPSQTLLTVVASAPTVVGAGYTYNLAVGAATSDGFPSNNTASGVFSVGAGADIELGSIANPNPVGTGQEIVFSVFVTNKGGASAIDPYFDVFFSPGVVYKSFAGPFGWSCGPSEGSISCTAATQATTPPTQVNIYATAPFDPGIASISVNGGAQNDTTPANNTTTAMTAVVAIADLALGSVSALPNVPIPGQEMTVSIPILNIGPQPAADAILVLQMPPSFQYVSVESPGWICGVSSFQVTCTATVIPFGTGVLALKLKPTTFGLFSLSASISSATLDPVAANNVSTLDDGLVHECASPGDCLGKPICEMGGRATINRCRECLSNPDCPVDRPVCDVLTKVCTVSICKSDADCSGAQGRCDIPVGKCVECLTNTHCNSGFVCAGQRCEKCDPRDPGSTCAPDKGGSACVFSQAEQYECGCVTDAFCGPSNSGRVCTASKSCIEGCRGTGGNGCASGFTCTSTTNAIGACQRVAPTDAGVDGSVSPSDAGITDGSTLPGLPDGSVILSDGGVLLPDGAVVALPEAGTPGNPNTRPSPFDDAGYDSKSTNTPVAVDCTLRTGGPSSGSSAAFYGMLVTAALVVARRRSKQV